MDAKLLTQTDRIDHSILAHFKAAEAETRTKIAELKKLQNNLLKMIENIEKNKNYEPFTNFKHLEVSTNELDYYKEFVNFMENLNYNLDVFKRSIQGFYQQFGYYDISVRKFAKMARYYFSQKGYELKTITGRNQQGTNMAIFQSFKKST